MRRFRRTVWRLMAGMVFALGVGAGTTAPSAQNVPSAWRTDFWGAELPLPPAADRGTLHIFGVYHARDEDFWIHFRYSLGPRPVDRPRDVNINAVYSAAKRAVIREFVHDIRGRTPPEVRASLTALSGEVDAYLREHTHRRIERPQRPSVKLPDGTSVVPDVNSNARHCIVPYTYYLSRRNAAGQQIDARMVIQLRSEPFPFSFPPDCESGNPNSGTLSVHGRDLHESIVDLGDGTWLLLDTWRSQHDAAPPAVIRFRGFLESPYLRQRPDLLVVDNAEIYRIFWDGITKAPRGVVPIEHGDRQVFERYRDRLGQAPTPRAP